MNKLFISMVVALAWMTTNLISFKYVCDYPEMGPRFYGFPFVQETNTSWVNSMSGEIYLLGMIGNLIFWTLIFRGIGFLFDLVQQKIIQKIYRSIRWVILTVSFYILITHFTAIDWRYSFHHDDFKLNYYQSEITCERTFIFFDHIYH